MKDEPTTMIRPVHCCTGCGGDHAEVKYHFIPNVDEPHKWSGICPRAKVQIFLYYNSEAIYETAELII